LSSQALWYTTRGFGLVALVLLTVTTVLGLAEVARYARPGTPRFVVAALHKNASLLAVVAIAIHVTTAVLDTFAPIHLIDVFVPLASKYRPVWTGLGALAFDLMLAVIVTSLLRNRIGQRAWRAVHWAAYASWPVAVLHGLGTGSDSKLGWVLFVYVACTVAVVAALWWRLAKAWSPVRPGVRGTAIAASVAVPLAIAAWAASGPTKAGWARRAGTPPSLLASSSAASTIPAARGPVTPTKVLSLPFEARFEGSQAESGPGGGGLVTVTISGTFTDNTSGVFELVLTGQPAEGGGVELTGSELTVGTAGDPSQYRGQVSQLDGETVVASVSSSSGSSATVVIEVRQAGGGAVAGRIRVQ
jgi:sulfoxide reductase heme-binding subunit YedZ